MLLLDISTLHVVRSISLISKKAGTHNTFDSDPIWAQKVVTMKDSNTFTKRFVRASWNEHTFTFSCAIAEDVKVFLPCKKKKTSLSNNVDVVFYLGG